MYVASTHARCPGWREAGHGGLCRAETRRGGREEVEVAEAAEADQDEPGHSAILGRVLRASGAW